MRPRWLILPGIMAVAVSYGLGRYTYGLFVPRMRTDMSLSTQLLGLIASSSYGAFLIASAITAIMAARTGPRIPVAVGTLSASAGMLLISMAHTPVLLTMGVVLAGSSPGWATAALSDAVVRLVPEQRRSRTWAIINSGTGFGVLAAGPIVLLAGSQWRTAWLIFSVLALVAALWNTFLLPSGPHRSQATSSTAGANLPKIRLRWLLSAASARLFGVAIVLGIAVSAYWTFAVDLIVSQRAASDHSIGPLFWTIVGVAGTAGWVAGDAVQRLGLTVSLRLTVTAVAAATGLLAAFPASWPAIVGSAALFGAAFIAVTGILGVWSIHLFWERPSAGFGATFFLLSFGQFMGPALFAAVAGNFGLTTTFYLATGLTAAALLIRPHRRRGWQEAPEGTGAHVEPDVA